jgi:hypothetical protein
VTGSQTPTLHESFNPEQSTDNPPQKPPSQTSPLVQRLESVQASPSFRGTTSHIPEPGSHMPTPQKLVKGEQSTGLPEQTPAAQVSFCVQASPSPQGPPSLNA